MTSLRTLSLTLASTAVLAFAPLGCAGTSSSTGTTDAGGSSDGGTVLDSSNPSDSGSTGDANTATDGSSGSRVDTILALTGKAADGKTPQQNNCGGCHGLDGKSGSAKEDTVALAKANARSFVTYVLNGAPSKGMPAFGTLTDQQIADILAYVKTL
jgi:mono/diheme cytochrome c family protein